MFSIYVMPTEEGLPPRAMLLPLLGGVPVAVVYDEDEWKIEGEPVDEELNEVITEHAKSLGVSL